MDYTRIRRGRCRQFWLWTIPEIILVSVGYRCAPSHIRVQYGRTDELGFSVVKNKVHVHDLQATVMHLLGIEHERLTFRFQGRDYRLTDVHGNLVLDLLT